MADKRKQQWRESEANGWGKEPAAGGRGGGGRGLGGGIFVSDFFLRVLNPKPDCSSFGVATVSWAKCFVLVLCMQELWG